MKTENLEFASFENMNIYQKISTEKLDQIFLDMLAEENTSEAMVLLTRVNGLDLYDFLADRGTEPYFLPHKKLTSEFLQNLVIQHIYIHGPCDFIDYFEDYFEVQE